MPHKITLTGFAIGSLREGDSYASLDMSEKSSSSVNEYVNIMKGYSMKQDTTVKILQVCNIKAQGP